MSDLLSQAQKVATQALNTASNLASQAANTAADLANQAASSETGQKVTEQAKALGAQAGVYAGQAAEGAKTLAGQAHAQAHALAPNIVPPPAAGVDFSSDLSPTNEQDKEKIEKLFAARASAAELQDKGILKGEPNDPLAGKKAELQKSMLEDKLESNLAQRPTVEDLVKKGILSPDEAV